MPTFFENLMKRTYSGFFQTFNWVRPKGNILFPKIWMDYVTEGIANVSADYAIKEIDKPKFLQIGKSVYS